jgi:hypothetical protein
MRRRRKSHVPRRVVAPDRVLTPHGCSCSSCPLRGVFCLSLARSLSRGVAFVRLFLVLFLRCIIRELCSSTTDFWNKIERSPPRGAEFGREWLPTLCLPTELWYLASVSCRLFLLPPSAYVSLMPSPVYISENAPAVDF